MITADVVNAIGELVGGTPQDVSTRTENVDGNPDDFDATLFIKSIIPDEGSIELLGEDITKLDEARLNEVRKKIGVLFQSGALFNSMTLRQNVALPLEIAGTPGARKRAEEKRDYYLPEEGDRIWAMFGSFLAYRAALLRLLIH